MCLSGQYTGSSTRIISILCGCVMSASNYNRRGLYRCQYILQPEGKCLNYVTLVVPEWLGKVQTVTSYINSLGKSVHLRAYGMVSLTFKFDCSFYDPPPPQIIIEHLAAIRLISNRRDTHNRMILMIKVGVGTIVNLRNCCGCRNHNFPSLWIMFGRKKGV